MTEFELRRIWRESIEHGTLSWKAFKFAARAVEQHVLDNLPDPDDDDDESEIVNSRPMTDEEWKALPPEQQAAIRNAEECILFGDTSAHPETFSGFRRHVDQRADGAETFRSTLTRWSEPMIVGTYPKPKDE